MFLNKIIDYLAESYNENKYYDLVFKIGHLFFILLLICKYTVRKIKSFYKIYNEAVSQYLDELFTLQRKETLVNIF